MAVRRTRNTSTLQGYYAYRLLRTPNIARRLGYIVLVIVGVLFLFMFAPWQQNIQATGEVTALSPEERPQNVPAVLDGIIAEWFVQEGQFVRKGDSIARIVEIKDKYLDPALLQRIGEMISGKEGSVGANQAKREALLQQYQALTDGLRLKLEQTQNKLTSARLKVSIDSAAVVSAQANRDVALAQAERMRTLFEQGLRSRTELENRELKLQEADAKLGEALNKLGATRQDLANAFVELSSVRADYLDKLSKALSDRNSTEAYISEAQAEIAKLRNEYANMAVRQEFHVIRAPQDGYVVQAQRRGLGETVKPGDAIVTIVPNEPHLAVALYVSATDVPLLTVGDEVRVQFDGWPAIQISGWPMVAVGTFGGRVAVIDRVDYDNTGKYRVLVQPDTTHDDPWPPQLRMGSGVYAWAMLDEVPVWFEMWRQLNGFPPSRQNAPTSSGYGGTEGIYGDTPADGSY